MDIQIVTTQREVARLEAELQALRRQTSALTARFQQLRNRRLTSAAEARDAFAELARLGEQLGRFSKNRLPPAPTGGDSPNEELLNALGIAANVYGVLKLISAPARMNIIGFLAFEALDRAFDAANFEEGQVALLIIDAISLLLDIRRAIGYS